MSVIKVYKVKYLLLTLHSFDVDYGNVAYQCVDIFLCQKKKSVDKFNAHATKLYTYLGEHEFFHPWSTTCIWDN